MPEFISTNIENGVGRIRLNRPEKRNALKRAFIEELNDAVAQMEAEESLRVLLLEAEGKVFCAGMDLGEMQERASSPDGKSEWLKDSEVYCTLLSRLFTLPVPTVAVLSGPALAGGVGMVLACDIVIASDNVFLMLPEPMRGITAAMVTPLLVHRAGAGSANYMLLSGERVNAGACLRMGIFHDVTAQEELAARRDSLVDSILTGSRSALAITKKHVLRLSAPSMLDMLKDSMTVSAEARETDDAREGLAAFLEKRNPNWQENKG
ncbi:MAG: enoyl-CoA hydratase-related protein [Planctomycetota bacterium]